MSKVRISIDGVEKTIDTDVILIIRNPEAERNRCAADMAYWGGIYGAKLEEQETAEAECDHWVAQMTVKILDTEEKASEWKVKAVVRADVGFMARHKALARTKRDVAAAKAIFDAYSRRADILARLIAKETSERVWAGSAGRASLEEPSTSSPSEGEFLERDRLELEAERAAEPTKPAPRGVGKHDKRMDAFVAKRKSVPGAKETGSK